MNILSWPLALVWQKDRGAADFFKAIIRKPNHFKEI
jgi:hypothetical protein